MVAVVLVQVGHKALKPANETDVSFTAKRLQVPLQKLGAEHDASDGDDMDTTHEGHSTAHAHKFPPVADILAHSRHHNHTVRRDAMQTLRGLWLANPPAVHAHLSSVLDALGLRMLDESGQVPVLCPAAPATGRQVGALQSRYPTRPGRNRLECCQSGRSSVHQRPSHGRPQ